jgi:hypothetical protein
MSLKVFDRLFEPSGRDLSLTVDEEWQHYGLKNRSFVCNPNGDVSVDGTKLKGLDGQLGFDEFTNRVEEIVKRSGEFPTMLKYQSRSSQAGKIGEEVQTAVNYKRRIDSKQISLKKKDWDEFVQLIRK